MLSKVNKEIDRLANSPIFDTESKSFKTTHGKAVGLYCISSQVMIRDHGLYKVGMTTTSMYVYILYVYTLSGCSKKLGG